jgi:hypothetical protein
MRLSARPYDPNPDNPILGSLSCDETRKARLPLLVGGQLEVIRLHLILANE